MNMKRQGKTVWIAALAMVASLALMGSPAGAGHPDDTVFVDAAAAPGGDGSEASPFQTIQEGIDHANPGDTVSVAAGIYAENVVINKNDLTVLGAKAGVPAGPDAVPAGRGADESIIEGVLPASTGVIGLVGGVTGFTLDGFTIKGRSADGQSAVFLRGNSHIIQNNIMEGATFGPPATGSHPTTAARFPSGVRSGNLSNVLIEHNNIQTFRYGMNLDGGVNDLQNTINGNYVTDARTSSIFLQGSLSNGHIISENVIENVPGHGIILGQGGHQITDNTIRNSVNVAIWAPVDSPRTDDISAIGNTVHDNGWGILFITGDHEARFNSIVGTTEEGLRNDGPGAVDGTCNWWGAADGPSGDGPGSGDVVENRGTGSLAFEPWLTAPPPGGLCDGPLPPPPPTPTSAEDCKQGGWQGLTDDTGRPFKNQGDCVSYVATGGRNPAAG